MPSWHTIVLNSAIYLADGAAWHSYSVFMKIHRFIQRQKVTLITGYTKIVFQADWTPRWSICLCCICKIIPDAGRFCRVR
ncbi:uncharacterized protein BO88DRAFT_110194 [Aspergillus vadensis CBS 113365]|uniref:Uncharacterized protein n=1 Tax=Aspergillus vadensis (strain CBS 113365 / IMI 142717 / IBT 24658) TaxID=1448311 RepID=A0A319BS00_ASPVC|nr:hypothetical protein BO88DRAFT_110194 [Aspergillus vadensis CBS 113365]PYH73990.1 hypothetical protein BO88DRAFT_110194 [Aspergillus vadensis CBS 113365]